MIRKLMGGVKGLLRWFHYTAAFLSVSLQSQGGTNCLTRETSSLFRAAMAGFVEHVSRWASLNSFRSRVWHLACNPASLEKRGIQMEKINMHLENLFLGFSGNASWGECHAFNPEKQFSSLLEAIEEKKLQGPFGDGTRIGSWIPGMPKAVDPAPARRGLLEISSRKCCFPGSEDLSYLIQDEQIPFFSGKEVSGYCPFGEDGKGVPSEDSEHPEDPIDSSSTGKFRNQVTQGKEPVFSCLSTLAFEFQRTNDSNGEREVVASDHLNSPPIQDRLHPLGFHGPTVLSDAGAMLEGRLRNVGFKGEGSTSEESQGQTFTEHSVKGRWTLLASEQSDLSLKAVAEESASTSKFFTLESVSGDRSRVLGEVNESLKMEGARFLRGMQWKNDGSPTVGDLLEEDVARKLAIATERLGRNEPEVGDKAKPVIFEGGFGFLLDEGEVQYLEGKFGGLSRNSSNGETALSLGQVNECLGVEGLHFLEGRKWKQGQCLSGEDTAQVPRITGGDGPRVFEPFSSQAEGAQFSTEGKIKQSPDLATGAMGSSQEGEGPFVQALGVQNHQKNCPLDPSPPSLQAELGGPPPRESFHGEPQDLSNSTVEKSYQVELFHYSTRDHRISSSGEEHEISSDEVRLGEYGPLFREQMAHKGLGKTDTSVKEEPEHLLGYHGKDLREGTIQTLHIVLREAEDLTRIRLRFHHNNLDALFVVGSVEQKNHLEADLGQLQRELFHSGLFPQLAVEIGGRHSDDRFQRNPILEFNHEPKNLGLDMESEAFPLGWHFPDGSIHLRV